MRKAQIDLVSPESSIDTTNDTIVIINCTGTLTGGRVLDVTGWPKTTIPGGHPIILDDDNEYKPIPINNDGKIIADKANKTVGILVNTILKKSPGAAIMIRGIVNYKAAVYEIPEACKTPLRLIQFTCDNA